MLLLHPLSMEDWVMVGAASPSAWSVWLVQFICLLIYVFQCGSSFGPWALLYSSLYLFLLSWTVTLWQMITRSAWHLIPIRVIESVLHDRLCKVVSISHHIGLVVRVEMLWNRAKHVILWLELLILPIWELLLLIHVWELLSLDHLGRGNRVEVWAEMILNFNWNFLGLSEIIGEKSKSMDSLMGELILLRHIFLVLDLDNAFGGSIWNLAFWHLGGHSWTLTHRSIVESTSFVTTIKVAGTVHWGTPFPLRQSTIWWTLSKLW